MESNLQIVIELTDKYISLQKMPASGKVVLLVNIIIMA